MVINKPSTTYNCLHRFHQVCVSSTITWELCELITFR